MAASLLWVKLRLLCPATTCSTHSESLGIALQFPCAAAGAVWTMWQPGWGSCTSSTLIWDGHQEQAGILSALVKQGSVFHTPLFSTFSSCTKSSPLKSTLPRGLPTPLSCSRLPDGE